MNCVNGGKDQKWGAGAKAFNTPAHGWVAQVREARSTPFEYSCIVSVHLDASKCCAGPRNAAMWARTTQSSSLITNPPPDLKIKPSSCETRGDASPRLFGVCFTGKQVALHHHRWVFIRSNHVRPCRQRKGLVGRPRSATSLPYTTLLTRAYNMN